MYHKRRNPASKIIGGPVRYAVINVTHQEVLTQNHQVIGEAFNSMMEDYNTIRGLVVVATRDDIILGEVNRAGKLKNNKIKLPKTIWDAPINLFFDPKLVVPNEVEDPWLISEEKKDQIVKFGMKTYKEVMNKLYGPMTQK